MHGNCCDRREFLKAGGAGAAAFMLGGCVDAARRAGRAGLSRKPNVVLMLTDDQGWGDVRSHGNALVDTPNMDNLAASGARFDRFFVSPVCAPTRAGLLTGRYHPRSGVHGVTRGYETMRSDEVTIAEILKAAGYATGCFGKWHNGAHWPYHPNAQGFDEFLGFCAGHWNNYFDTQLDHNGTIVRSKGYINDVFTDAAIDFIRMNRDRPFLCYVPYNTPHSPFQVSDTYFNKYKNRGLDDRLACVYAMCENLDDNIGRILAVLDELKLADDTIVIFMTDNGANTERFDGDMKGRKGSIHEGGSRVPCFIRWPGHIEAQTEVKKITSHIDLLPTLVELTGVEPIETKPLDGASLVPLLGGQDEEWPDRTLFTFWGNRGAVRTEQYRLAVYANRLELYDMKADPSETMNIAAKKPQVVRELKAAYDAWLKDVSAGGFAPIPIPIGYKERPEVVMPGHEAFLEPADRKTISYVGRSGWANDYVTNWTSTDAYPYWEVDVVRGGTYEIEIRYVCASEDVGAKVRVEIGGESLTGEVSEAHDPPIIESPDRWRRGEVYEKVWAVLKLGAVRLDRCRGQLVVRALTKPGRTVMDLKAVGVKRID